MDPKPSFDQEISEAVQQFETESTEKPAPFGNEGAEASSLYPPHASVSQSSIEKPSGMIGMVMKLSSGTVKTRKQANAAMLIFVVLSAVITLFLLTGGFAGKAPNTTPIYQEDLTPTARATIPGSVLKTIPYKNGNK